MELIKKEYYDDMDGNYVGTRYFCDFDEISEEEYYDMVDEEEDIIDLLVDNFADEIAETEGCPECIRDILYNFFDAIMDILEDEEEDYEE